MLPHHNSCTVTARTGKAENQFCWHRLVVSDFVQNDSLPHLYYTGQRDLSHELISASALESTTPATFSI